MNCPLVCYEDTDNSYVDVLFTRCVTTASQCLCISTCRVPITAPSEPALQAILDLMEMSVLVHMLYTLCKSCTIRGFVIMKMFEHPVLPWYNKRNVQTQRKGCCEFCSSKVLTQRRQPVFVAAEIDRLHLKCNHLPLQGQQCSTLLLCHSGDNTKSAAQGRSALRNCYSLQAQCHWL